MSNVSPMRDTATIQSVDRAVAILELLARSGWSAGADVARDLGVHRSTALRLLATLERHGLVERDARSARYRLGPRLPQLASAVSGSADLRRLARPVCEALALKAGETVTLDVLEGDDIVPIEQATAAAALVGVNWLGRRTPAHCTASGKAILAFGPADVRRRLLALPLLAPTRYTLADRARLEAALEEVRQAGFASTSQELELGLDAIAAPVRAADGRVVGAIDVSGPTARLGAGRRLDLARFTVAAAAELSHRLGYRERRATA